MNEMYTCMKYYPEENKIYPTIVLRQLPYSKDIFPKLSHIYIQENMIITDDMGFHDHERFNWVNLDPQNSFIANYPQFMAASNARRQDPFTGKDVPLFPFINILSIRRYGLSQRQFQSEFLMVPQGERKQGSSKTDVDLGEEWMRKLIDWWQNHDRYESGTILVKGFSEVNTYEVGEGGKLILNNYLEQTAPEKASKKIASDQYNIGNNIFLNSRDRLYQLEGFSLEWQAPGESVTTLAVTKGVHWTPKMSVFKYVDEVDSEEQKSLSVTSVKRK